MMSKNMVDKEPVETSACGETSEYSENEEKRPETSEKEYAPVIEEESAMAPPVEEEAETRAALSPLNCCPLLLEDILNPIEKQLQYLSTKSEELGELLLQCSLQYEGFGDVLQGFLRTCEPFFTYLESSARDCSPDQPPLPPYIRTRLLHFSEQLCIKLEQLVLMCASFSYVSLDETDPLAISHFYLGQCQVDNIKLSVFRYCRLSPLLARNDSGPYKCMRWNVERERGTEGKEGEGERERGMGGAQGGQEEKGEGVNSIEYYFLCCEGVPVVKRLSDEGHKGEMRTWTIGQWVQTWPDPNTEDLWDWVLCKVPEGQYRKLLCLGEEEPSPCRATDYLLEALSSHTAPTKPAPCGEDVAHLSHHETAHIFARLYSLSA